MRITKEIIGKEVLNKNVEIMGKVIDVDFDVDDLTIESLIVSKGGIQETLNISKSEDVIPINMVRTIGDKILLKDDFSQDFEEIKAEIVDLKEDLKN